MAAALITPIAQQARDTQKWMTKTLFCSQGMMNKELSKKFVAIIGGYTLENHDLWHVKSAAQALDDRNWVQAIESAETSPYFLLKNHELAMRAVRLQAKVGPDGNVVCDQVVLTGVQHEYPPTDFIQPAPSPFSLVSNQLRDFVTIEPTAVHCKETRTQFWLCTAGKIYCVTIRNPHEIDWEKTVPKRLSVQGEGLVWGVEYSLHKYRPHKSPNPVAGCLYTINTDWRDRAHIKDPLADEVSEQAFKGSYGCRYWIT
jgi:hypothetical protein